MAWDELDAAETVTFVTRTPSAKEPHAGPPLELDEPLDPLELAMVPLLELFELFVPPVLPEPPEPSIPPELPAPPEPVVLPEISPVQADKIADKPTKKAIDCLDMA